MGNMKLSPPWVTYANKIEALFKGDDDINIKFDEQNYDLKIFVADAEKAEALAKLLPLQKQFGNVIVKIAVVPPDNEAAEPIEVFRKAFKNNPNVSDIVTEATPFGYNLNFVVFKKEVIQFFNDDTSDLYGVLSTLNENIAREVFGESYDTVYFCTDVK